MLISACSSDGTPVLDIEEPTIPNPFPDYVGMVASRPDVKSSGDEDPLTRSTLVYDNNKKIMLASWEASDALGVFPVTHEGQEIKAANSTQQKWVVDSEQGFKNGDSFSTAVFVKDDNHVATLEAGAKYVAFSPFTQATSEYSYDNVPVTYRNQMQRVNVNIDAYYRRNSSVEMMNAYLESEPYASAHLNDYDYLASDAIATPTGGAHFIFTRLGSVSRFFLSAPEKAIYDKMVFFNDEVDFTLDAKMNVKDKTLEPTAKGHSLSLKLGENGFDLTNVAGNNSFYSVGGKDYGYIIAYLMSAPTELLSHKKCTLYLLGHIDVDKDRYDALTPESEKLLYEKISENCYRKKTYYKATLNYYDMEQDKLQRWTPSLGKDDPIEFETISVQQWVEETGYTNDKGTEKW